MNMTKETIKKPDSFTNQAFSYKGIPLILLVLASRIVTLILNYTLFHVDQSLNPTCMGNTI